MFEKDKKTNDSFYEVIPFAIVIFLISLIIILIFDFVFKMVPKLSLAYLLGAVVSALVFVLRRLLINHFTLGYHTKTALFFIFFNILALLAYAFVMYVTFVWIDKFALITGVIGTLLLRIAILFRYVIFNKRFERKQMEDISIDSLELDEEIKFKLKEEGFNNLYELTLVTREELITRCMLTNEEFVNVLLKMRDNKAFLKDDYKYKNIN